MTELTDETCIAQKFVLGEQVALAHMIADPDPHLYPEIGLPVGSSGTIGVLTITPSKATVIAIDIATKSAKVELTLADRFSGSLLITSWLANVESSVTGIVTTFQAILGFTPTLLTRTQCRT